MSKYPRQVVIENPLWAFMRHCEVYCSAACCGKDAFEVHHALILRKVIDENLAGMDGDNSFKLAWQQLKNVISFVNSLELARIHDKVPIWNDEPVDFPQYWMSVNEFKDWLSEWNVVFEKASRYGGLEKT